MKFESRKSIFFKLFTVIFVALMLTLTFVEIYFRDFNESINIFIILLALSVAVLILWIYFGTIYELNSAEFKYRSGLISGKMKIEKITEIILNSNRFIVTKPAAAANGLIIKCGIYDEVYITPETNELFIEKILDLNKDIKISNRKKS